MLLVYYTATSLYNDRSRISTSEATKAGGPKDELPVRGVAVAHNAIPNMPFHIADEAFHGPVYDLNDLPRLPGVFVAMADDGNRWIVFDVGAVPSLHDTLSKTTRRAYWEGFADGRPLAFAVYVTRREDAATTTHLLRTIGSYLGHEDQPPTPPDEPHTFGRNY
jgi:hypothetical protein